MISTADAEQGYDYDAWIQPNKTYTADCVENPSDRDEKGDTQRTPVSDAEKEKVAKTKFEKDKAKAEKDMDCWGKSKETGKWNEKWNLELGIPTCTKTKKMRFICENLIPDVIEIAT